MRERGTPSEVYEGSAGAEAIKVHVIARRHAGAHDDGATVLLQTGIR